MTRARSPSASSSLNITTSPTCSKSRAATTLSASLSMTSWPRRRSSRSTAGLTLTRSLRPPVKTSTESSSLRARKVPKPAGGWASRSTSSLSFMIWSRASRSVWARRSFCEVTAASERWVSARRSSSPREPPGASVSRRRRSPTSASRKRTCSINCSGSRPGVLASLSCIDTVPPPVLATLPSPPRHHRVERAVFVAIWARGRRRSVRRGGAGGAVWSPTARLVTGSLSLVTKRHVLGPSACRW